MSPREANYDQRSNYTSPTHPVPEGDVPLFSVVRDLFLDAFCAFSTVHKKDGGMSDDDSEYGPRGCNFCFTDPHTGIKGDEDDRRYETPRRRPLAVAAGYDALQDVEGRRVLITPTRRRATPNGSHSPGGGRSRVSNSSAPGSPR